MTPALKKAFARVDRYILQEMRSASIPGLALGITQKDRLLRASTYGFQDVAARTPVKRDTLFQIGSISKSFASLVILQLSEQRKIDLNRPVKDYLPWLDLRSRFDAVTLHHLLTHTAGISSGTEETLGGTTEAMRLLDAEVTAPPGTYFHYSNAGYKIVGLVIEKALGMSNGTAIKERILKPLRMNSTESEITQELRSRTAVGYGPCFDDRPAPTRGRVVPATWSDSDTADGSISSTAGDMAAYVRMLLNRGKGPDDRLISEKSFEQLTQKAIRPLDSMHGEYYGYGLNVMDQDGHKCIGHSGGMVGFVSGLLADLDQEVGVITLMNGITDTGDICRSVLKVMGAALDGKPLPEIKATNRTKVENAAEYQGTYRRGKDALRVKANGSRLVLEGKRPVFLEKRGIDEFLANSPGLDLFPIRFTRDKDRVVGAEHGADVYSKSGHAEPTATEYPRAWDAYPGHYRTHNPWLSNFRVVLRLGELIMIEPAGKEHPLIPLGDGRFRVDRDERAPERISFDLIHDGKALRATISGCGCYRSFTP